MHYSGFDFSKNGRLTIATVDPRNQELIGRRDGLSHRDTHLANLMYGCIDKWKQACSMDSDPCQNGGTLVQTARACVRKEHPGLPAKHSKRIILPRNAVTAVRASQALARSPRPTTRVTTLMEWYVPSG
nr:uncharacterized protein LOC113808545 [Penaeus vannamei]